MQQFTANKNTGINHFEAIFEYATLGIVVTDGKAKIWFVNPFALKEFGYTEEELIGKQVEILVPKPFHKNHITYHKNFMEVSQTRLMGEGRDLFAVRKDGTEFPVEISLSNYINNGDKFVISFVSNISVRKKAEGIIEKLNSELEATVAQRTKDLELALQELKLSKHKLEKVQAFQKAVLDNAGAMIIATDEKGLITFFNPEASFNIGYDEAEVINKHTLALFYDKKEISRKRKFLLKEFGVEIENDFDILVEKAKRNIHDEEEYTYLRKNGTSFPVSLTITAIKESHGVITGFMGIAIDISERKRTEEDLHTALEREKELNELKTRFVSMASHEFRTPLSTVLSSAYLIEKYSSSDDQPKRERHLQRIISSVNMLTDILNDFLSQGKIEEGKIRVRFNRFNIQELVVAINEEIKNNLKPKQKITYAHEGDTDTLLDASLLKHIIMNLISNASKFSPEGSVLEIKTTNKNNLLTLSVKDNGIGISKDDQAHLMERFFRGTNAANIQGTGLGLHIVSKYAELMNGSVTCKSELEKGTEFIIIFTFLK